MTEPKDWLRLFDVEQTESGLFVALDPSRGRDSTQVTKFVHEYQGTFANPTDGPHKTPAEVIADMKAAVRLCAYSGLPASAFDGMRHSVERAKREEFENWDAHEGRRVLDAEGVEVAPDDRMLPVPTECDHSCGGLPQVVLGQCDPILVCIQCSKVMPERSSKE